MTSPTRDENYIERIDFVTKFAISKQIFRLNHLTFNILGLQIFDTFGVGNKARIIHWQKLEFEDGLFDTYSVGFLTSPEYHDGYSDGGKS